MAEGEKPRTISFRDVHELRNLELHKDSSLEAEQIAPKLLDAEVGFTEQSTHEFSKGINSEEVARTIAMFKEMGPISKKHWMLRQFHQSERLGH